MMMALTSALASALADCRAACVQDLCERQRSFVIAGDSAFTARGKQYASHGSKYLKSKDLFCRKIHVHLEFCPYLSRSWFGVT